MTWLFVAAALQPPNRERSRRSAEPAEWLNCKNESGELLDQIETGYYYARKKQSKKKQEVSMREKIAGTKLYVRNFGVGRSRILLIEPEDVTTGYAPIRISGCSVILFNERVRSELSKFYYRVSSRPKRNKVFPGGISSAADAGLKQFVGR